MNNERATYYNVEVYIKTILNEWYKCKTEKFNNLEEAIKYARETIKYGNHARVYEVSRIIGWE
jgi:hypothetical protein